MPPISFDTFLGLTQSSAIPVALAQLESSATPSEVAAAYDAFLRAAYWKQKNIGLVVALARAGIPFCQRHAAEDASARADLLATAKMLAYNLASFTWPGWDEPGIELTPATMAQGLSAARLNLQLAIDLQKPADKIRAAHWLLGAQLLAAPHAGHLEEASGQFAQAMPPPPVAAHDEYWLARGYGLLTDCLRHEPQAQAAWSALLAELQAAGEGAKFMHDQLQTAYRIFSVPAL